MRVEVERVTKPGILSYTTVTEPPTDKSELAPESSLAVSPKAAESGC